MTASAMCLRAGSIKLRHGLGTSAKNMSPGLYHLIGLMRIVVATMIKLPSAQQHLSLLTVRYGDYLMMYARPDAIWTGVDIIWMEIMKKKRT